jgi:2Fe-2S ferredoxin
LNNRKLTVGSLIMHSSHSVENNQNVNLTAASNKTYEYADNAHQYVEQRGILISQNNHTFYVKPVRDETLLDSALEQGHTLQYKCKKGTCGQCMVKILKGKDQLNTPNEQEKSKLDGSLEDDYRLACQTLYVP